MSMLLSARSAPVSALSHPASFCVYRSLASPTYYQLSLDDGRGQLAHWILPLPLKQLPKRPALLWQLPSSASTGGLTCLDAGWVQLAPAQAGTQSSLGTNLQAGLLRLHFDGQLLRGYFRLKCLPAGGRQLWQLTPIGYL